MIASRWSFWDPVFLEKLVFSHFCLRSRSRRTLENAPSLVCASSESLDPSFLVLILYFPFTAQGEVIQRAGWQSTLQRVDTSEGTGGDSVSENIQITLWDFAAHPEADFDRQSFEPMHRGMHRLFMTNTRTLYIITVNLSKFNATEMDYWVQNANDYAPNSPIIIAGTHQDSMTHQRVAEMEIFIKERYRKIKNVKEFFAVSCTSLKNITKLKNGITRYAHESLTRLVPSTMTLAERIADLDGKLKLEEAIYQLRRKGKNTITMTELISLARGTMPDASANDIQSAIAFVSGLGACTTFPSSLCEKIPRANKMAEHGTSRLLLDLVVINPNWLVKLLLPIKLLFVKKAMKIPGIIKLANVLKCWSDSEIDPALHDDLFDLLIYFKIMYALSPLISL